MSKLKNFVSGLSTNASTRMNKNLLLKDIDSTINITRELVKPSTENASVGTGPELKTKWSQTRAAMFNRAVGNTKPGANMFYSINLVVGRVIEVMEDLKKFFEGSTEVNIEGLNYQSATAIQLYYISRWYIDYSKDFLLLLYTNEMSSDVSSDRIAPPFTKAEVEEIENKFSLYIQFTTFFGSNMKMSVNEYLSKLPDMEVTDESESAIESLMRGDKSFKLVDTKEVSNFMHGPGFFIASVVAQRQEQRYQSAKMEADSVKLRILQVEQLKSSVENGGDANGRTLENITKELDYNNKRLRDLRKDIDKMEKKYEL